MFVCDGCKSVVPPKVKQLRMVIGVRPTEYTNEYTRVDEYDRKRTVVVESVGTEVTAEVSLCAACAGVPPVPPQPTQPRVFGKPEFYEKPADTFRVKLVSFAIDSTLRALDVSNRRNNGRRRLAEQTVPMLKQFVDENKQVAL